MFQWKVTSVAGVAEASLVRTVLYRKSKETVISTALERHHLPLLWICFEQYILHLDSELTLGRGHDEIMIADLNTVIY